MITTFEHNGKTFQVRVSDAEWHKARMAEGYTFDRVRVIQLKADGTENNSRGALSNKVLAEFQD